MQCINTFFANENAKEQLSPMDAWSGEDRERSSIQLLTTHSRTHWGVRSINRLSFFKTKKKTIFCESLFQSICTRIGLEFSDYLIKCQCIKKRALYTFWHSIQYHVATIMIKFFRVFIDFSVYTYSSNSFVCEKRQELFEENKALHTVTLIDFTSYRIKSWKL